MTKFRKITILTTAVLFMFGFVFICQRLFDPDRACLKWNGIKVIVFKSEAALLCESVNRLERLRVSTQLKDWVRRINKLDRLSWIKPASKGVLVRIDAQNPKSFDIDGNTANIGVEIADKPGQLERAVLTAWVQANWPEHDDLTQDVMVDLFTWSAMGDRTWSDPTRNEVTAPAERLKFALSPQTRETYCDFPFRSLKDIGDCQAKSNRNPGEEIAPAKFLRPLISWTLWTFVRDLPASQQIQFFRAMVSEHFEGEQNEAALLKGYQPWAKAKALSLLSRWALSTETDSKNWKRIFHKADLNEPLAFDLTVEVSGEDLAKRVLSSLKKWSTFSPKYRVMVIAKNKKWVFPENVKVDFMPSDFETRRHVILACQWPKPKDAMAIKSHLLYAIQVCGEEKLPSWREILSVQTANLPNRARVSSTLPN